jgi:hypothetical protein
MASSLDSIHEEDPDAKKAVLVTRRCIILGLVGATPASNPSLGSILQQGYLNAVKQWMDEILHGSVGELFSKCRMHGCPNLEILKLFLST